MNSCFVLGNGPSLSKIDNKVLDILPTFGSNRIFLKYVPTFYVVINPTEAKKYPQEIEELKCMKFVTDKVSINGVIPLHSTTEVDFSLDPLKVVNEGWSVTYVSLQLAHWMGFERVYLLGCDHRYSYQGEPNENIKWDGADPNHFSRDYVLPGESWNCPDLEKSTHYYRIAKDFFEYQKKEIINLTEDSALDVFPKGKLEDL